MSEFTAELWSAPKFHDYYSERVRESMRGDNYVILSGHTPLTMNEILSRFPVDKPKEGMNMEQFLRHLIAKEGLTVEQVDAINEIIKHADWEKRLMLFLLVGSVGTVNLAPADLGYEERTG